jgi:hypothetical protein
MYIERDEKIIEMYCSGISANTISNGLGICRRTVYRVLERHNILLHKNIEKQCLICCKKCVKNICGTCNTNLRRFRVKQKAVEYLGGKCNRCGWSGHISGFDFHHIEPNKKDFNPSGSKLANKSWLVAKKELDKCELLCALCHREEHCDYHKLYELSKTYKGKEFKEG